MMEAKRTGEVMKMPRGDRTGPAGYGAMTGRGMGYCAGYPHPGYVAPARPMGVRLGATRNAGLGRGIGSPPGRRGFGGGMRRRYL